MTLLLTFVVIITAAAVSGEAETSDLPHPWLSLDLKAKVLHLQCKPPAEISIQAVYGLRLTAFLSNHNENANLSLVNLTSHMNEAKVSAIFDIFSVSFQGTWSSREISLDLHIPVTVNELGKYFCTVEYGSDDSKQLENFTTALVVDTYLVNSHTADPSKKENNFQVNVVDAHKISVTWTKPNETKFREGSVSRIEVDTKGSYISPPMSLFTTNGISSFVYDLKEVLMTRVNPKDGSNFTMTLYVKADRHMYRYTCSIPYPSCTGHRAAFCKCYRDSADLDTQRCPMFSEGGVLYIILSIIVSNILVIIGIVIVICLYSSFHRRREQTSSMQNSSSNAGIKHETKANLSTTDTEQATPRPPEKEPATPAARAGIELSTPACSGTSSGFEVKVGTQSSTDSTPQHWSIAAPSDEGPGYGDEILVHTEQSSLLVVKAQHPTGIVPVAF